MIDIQNFPQTKKEIELYLLLKEMERHYQMLRIEGNIDIDFKIFRYMETKKRIDLMKQQYMRVLHDQTTEESDIKFLREFK